MNPSGGGSLRERQAEQVRLAVLEAVVAELESRAVDEISVADVAAAAGVSLRTVYRYFPDRASLLHAAGEHLYGSLGVPFDIAGPDQIAASFLDAARRLSGRPALARALVQTTAGRAARSNLRRERVAAIRTALKPLTDGADPEAGRSAAAVITHLCGASSWLSMLDDDPSLTEEEAQTAVAWAIDVLVRALDEDASGNPARTPRRSR
jgi:AcrR family transcriptional regulator